MQFTVYKCDQCKKEIGKTPHFMLNFAGNGNTSGIAHPPESINNKGMHWKVSTLPRTWVHLHLNCVPKYFEKLAKESLGV